MSHVHLTQPRIFSFIPPMYGVSSEIRAILALLLLAVSVVTPAMAEPIYRWQDDQGVVHYSSDKPNAAAKPADLPRITRGDMRMASPRLETCDTHGGVNCQAGPDTDGSVICFDNYTGAAALFRFNCNSPKLEVSDITELNEKGEFTVFVRNSKSVAASKPELIMKPQDLAFGIKLEGPDEIEPFGIAEFSYKPESKGLVTAKPSLAQLTVTCTNCP